MSVSTINSEVMYPRVYAPVALEDRMEQLVGTYQKAFAAPPWNEVSKCMGTEAVSSALCADGFSSVEVGDECKSCGLCPQEQAYPAESLAARFQAIEGDYTARWYIEETGDKRIALAVLARSLTPSAVAQEKYRDPDMRDWVTSQYEEPEKKVVWLDEVFADTNVRERGNLVNFGSMCRRLAVGPEVSEIAFRTVNPKLIRAAQRDFGASCEIFDPVLGQVPDRRKFVKVAL